MALRVKHVLTLIGPPDAQSVTEEVAKEAQRSLAGPSVPIDALQWLKPGVAVDIPFDRVLPERAANSAAKLLADRSIDVAVQRPEGRKKRLLVADMDSTIIGQECLDELADLAGLGAQVADLTARAMAGEIEFAGALRARVALFAGLPVDLLQRTYDDRVTLNPGARTLVQTMAASGAVTALVSGGFQFFTSRVAAAAGFDTYGGNLFEIEGGVLTGGITGNIVGAEGKRSTLAALMTEHRIPAELTVAVGDGANDIAMLAAAGLGVAVRPKQVVRDAADVVIDHGDLTALLFLQGYSADDFVGD